jgi:hypothetical protein
MKLRLHRDDLPALIAIVSWLILVILILFINTTSYMSAFEIHVGEVVNYGRVVDFLGPPKVSAIPLQVLYILGLIWFTSIIIGWVFGSRRTRIAMRLVFLVTLFGCCIIIIYSMILPEFTSRTNEFYHLKRAKFEEQFYNLAVEYLEERNPDGVSHRYNYWLLKCDDYQRECMVMFSTYFQRQYYSFENVPTDLFIDDSTRALVMTVDNNIVFTIPASDN